MDVTQVIRNEELPSAVIEASWPESEHASWLQRALGVFYLKGGLGFGVYGLGRLCWLQASRARNQVNIQSVRSFEANSLTASVTTNMTHSAV